MAQTRKEQLLEVVRSIETSLIPIREELAAIEKVEKAQDRRVYIILAKIRRYTGYDHYSFNIEAVFETLEEAQAALPDSYRSGNNMTTFEIVEKRIGEKKSKEDILRGYYSD